ncbi:MAG: pxpB [Chitinophagaceae bacterium]|nr:pxpB [Chitinophagaceae bacterium]
MSEQPAYTIFPLGDSALTIDFCNSIDEAINQKVLALFHSLRENPAAGIIEAVPAYSSITIYYDMLLAVRNNQDHKTAFEIMTERMEKRLQDPLSENNLPSQFLRIPVCYHNEFGLDIDELAATNKITAGEVIQIHTSKVYGVYMLGFLPGFSYMGKVDDKIAMPRKTNPRQRVESGSVGIAGYQTGIYPLASPGGWQIIGRTPVKLFDSDNKELTLLKPGDKVQFYSISKNEFNSY